MVPEVIKSGQKVYSPYNDLMFSSQLQAPEGMISKRSQPIMTFNNRKMGVRFFINLLGSSNIIFLGG